VPLVEDPYYRLDGKMIAHNAAELLGGKLLQPINITETMDEEGTLSVWTNTTPEGVTRSEAEDCQSFTSGEQGDWGYFGLTSKTDGQWTDVNVLKSYCSEESRLYCFSAAF